MGKTSWCHAMSAIGFRPMIWDDIDAVVALEKASFSLPWTRTAFESELTTNSLAHYIIMEEDGHLVGYAGMWVILDEAHVMNVAILPSRRAQGLGKLLMQKLIETAVNLGALTMTLEVRRSNHAARRLYEWIGFVERGVRPGYYTDNGEDALLLWLEELKQACLK